MTEKSLLLFLLFSALLLACSTLGGFLFFNGLSCAGVNGKYTGDNSYCQNSDYCYEAHTYLLIVYNNYMYCIKFTTQNENEQ